MGTEQIEKITAQDFIKLGEIISENSNGKIRVAFNEKDNCKKRDTRAAHFLKLKEKRIGRDLELYGFMAKICPEQTLPDFAELLLGIKFSFPQSYEKASVQLKDLGKKVYEGEILVSWNNLF